MLISSLVDHDAGSESITVYVPGSRATFGSTSQYVCEEAEEKCPVVAPRGEKLYWPVADPAAASGTDDEILQAFRGARDEITRRIDEWLSSTE